MDGVGQISGGFIRLDAAAVHRLLTDESQPLARELLVAGEIVRQGARAQVGVHKPDPWGRPTNRRPGQLRDSLVKRLVQTPRGVACIVGSNDPIAFLHHEGTEPHVIRPKNKPRLIFWKGGVVVVALRVNHPGTKPNRYLVDQVAKLRSRY